MIKELKIKKDFLTIKKVKIRKVTVPGHSFEYHGSEPLVLHFRTNAVRIITK